LNSRMVVAVDRDVQYALRWRLKEECESAATVKAL